MTYVDELDFTNELKDLFEIQGAAIKRALETRRIQTHLLNGVATRGCSAVHGARQGRERMHRPAPAKGNAQAYYSRRGFAFWVKNAT